MASVDVYIDFLDHHQHIVRELRTLLLDLGLQETMKYGLPFYTFKGNMCYINVRKTDVVLGFYYGASLDVSFDVTQKMVGHIIIDKTIDTQRITQAVHVAKTYNTLKYKV
ncbi:MAG: DUF1801 domain-containing protein [Candidatus Woesearchaeota archaeon]